MSEAQNLTAGTAPATPELWLVVDDTAQEDIHTEAGAIIKGDRVHQMSVDNKLRPFKFKFGEPTAMPPAVAIKFLATPTFRLVDENGQDREWRNPPRQPGQFEAGEQFRLADDQTIAGYHELTVEALRVRSLQMAGGETIPRSAKKEDIIAFIVRATIEKRKATSVDEGAEDDRSGFYAPEPESGGFFSDDV